MSEDFRALVENSPDGVAVTQSGNYVFVNRAWAALLDRSVEELLGRSVMADLEVADRERLRRQYDNRASELGDYGFIRNDGEILTLHLRSVPMEQFDGYPCIALIATDMTETRRLQARLLLVDRLMSVGALASGVAHEINNPLSYVMGNLSFLSEELSRLLHAQPEQVRADVEEALSEALEGAQRVRSIVRNLQAFARADQEGRQALDVNKTIEAAVGMAWIELRHRAQLSQELGKDLPPVNASEARLGQVVLNLLLNAAHALPDGEADQNRITIRTDYAESLKRVRVEIIDTGPGIPPEIVDRVFEPFFSTKPVGIGTGLGLSIVHSIVEAMGGSITVDSKLGVGSRFTVLLPTVKPEPALSSTDLVDHTASVRGRILIVDDEPLIAASLKRALRHHAVVVVRSGREAIEKIDQDGDFDLVLLDVMMPDISGVDVLEWIREHRPNLGDRVVFMTGGLFTERVQAFLKTVDNHRIQKPFEVEKIRRYVDRTIEQGRMPTGDLP